MYNDADDSNAHPEQLGCGSVRCLKRMVPPVPLMLCSLLAVQVKLFAQNSGSASSWRLSAESGGGAAPPTGTGTPCSMLSLHHSPTLVETLFVARDHNIYFIALEHSLQYVCTYMHMPDVSSSCHKANPSLCSLPIAVALHLYLQLPLSLPWLRLVTSSVAGSRMSWRLSLWPSTSLLGTSVTWT